jgi:plastocyanin
MRARLALALSLIGAGFVTVVIACSDDQTIQPLNIADSGGDVTVPPVDSGHDAGRDAADAADAAADTSTIDAADAAAEADAHDVDAFEMINGCAQGDFVDHSDLDASRVVYFTDSAFPFNSEGGVNQYTPQCMTIKVGETVGWAGNFEAHPLGPNDNKPNNPIASGVFEAGSDGAYSATFAEAGIFGYECQSHTSMHGAINVKP